MSQEDKKIKPVSAEMLPNLRLRITFDNGEIRYLSQFSTVELFIQPLAYTWIGNEIEVLEDGSIRLNDLHIPYDVVINQSTSYLEEEKD